MSGRPVWSVFERARAPRHFLLGKGHPDEEIVHFYWSISRAPMQSPGGMEAIDFVASLKYQAESGVNLFFEGQELRPA